MKKVLIASLIVMMSGCAVHQTPFSAYKEKTTPLNHTAVLVVWDNKESNNTGADAIGVTQVDDIAMSHIHGYPFWVRVTPGTHSFKLQYVADSTLSGPGLRINFKRAEIALTVENMKAGHTYYTRYERQDGKVISYVEDLGANANFGMVICGMYGDCKTLHRAKFE